MKKSRRANHQRTVEEEPKRADKTRWSNVTQRLRHEIQKFDEVLKHLRVLDDEGRNSLLAFIERQDIAYTQKVWIADLLFELEWRLRDNIGYESYEESVAWDEMRSQLVQSEKESEQDLKFVGWAAHVGRMIGRAWLRRDRDFFARHAPLWRALCAEKRLPSGQTNAARICAAAIQLRERLKKDPTKKQLREQIAIQGLRISDKDWPKYLRKCGLTFLPHARSGRRPQIPRKPN
jgi:hypothetical protein